MLRTLNSWQSKGKDSQNIVVDYRFHQQKFCFSCFILFQVLNKCLLSYLGGFFQGFEVLVSDCVVFFFVADVGQFVV